MARLVLWIWVWTLAGCSVGGHSQIPDADLRLVTDVRHDGGILVHEQGWMRGDCREGGWDVWMLAGSVARRVKYLSYRDGELNGVCVEWGREGELVRIYSYYEGVLHGIDKCFDSTGQVVSRRGYWAGEPHGLWCIRQTENPDVSDVVEYVRGKVIAERVMASQNVLW